MKIYKILLFILLQNISCIIYAGNVDLSIQMDLESVTEVDYLDSGTFTITITNFGPDIAGGDSTSNFPISAISNVILVRPRTGLDLFISQNTDIQQECFFITTFGSPLPGGLPGQASVFAFPKIPPNSSITCYGRYLINFKHGSRTFNFNVRSSTFLDTELNPADNIYNFTFRIRPQRIPLISGYGLFLLILMIITIVWIKRPLSYSMKITDNK